MQKLIRKGERFKGSTLGIDLHKAFFQYSLLNESGDEVENQRAVSTRQELSKLIDRLTRDGTDLQVALEASGCFMWAYDLLVKKLGKEHVHVAAPSKVRVIAEAGDKTDATDGWWLSYLLYERRLPEAFVAEGDLRELRIVCREYRSVVDERSDLVRRMRSHLSQLGMKIGKSDFKSEVGRERIKVLVKEVVEKEGSRGEAIGHLWERINALDQEVSHWYKRIKELSAKFEEIKLLDEELAGVGELTAAIIWSELGDPRRYKSAKAYAKATGLTPGYRESGGKRSSLGITREGSAHARWAMTRAALSCTRCTQGPGLVVGKWIQKMKQRKSASAAIVAAGRKLSESVWRLLQLGEAFDLARAFGTPGNPAPRG